MIILSNTEQQTIAPGAAITFDKVVLHTGCGECHRPNSNSVKMRAHGIYEISFSGNISGAAGNELELALSVGGEPLLETTMLSAATGETLFNNVATNTAVKNCCGDYDRVTVVNTGTTDLTIVPNALLFVKRVS